MEAKSNCLTVFVWNAFVRQTIETVIIGTLWFQFRALAIHYYLATVAYIVYFAARFLGVVNVRRILKNHCLHPRHQSVNVAEKGSATLVILDHFDKQTETRREEVKRCLVLMQVRGLIGFVLIALISLYAKYLEGKQTSS